MSIQAINALWETKQAQAQAKRREADLLEAEARGLRQALEALRREQEEEVSERPLMQQSPNAQIEKLRKANPGRQPGAISTKWKRHLIVLHDKEELFDDDSVAQLVLEIEDRVMKPSEVKRLFENFIRYGHVKIDDDNFYYVPETVIQKFKSSLRGESEGGALEDQVQRSSDKESDDTSDASDEETSTYEGDIALSMLKQHRLYRAT